MRVQVHQIFKLHPVQTRLPTWEYIIEAIITTLNLLKQIIYCLFCPGAMCILDIIFDLYQTEASFSLLFF